MTLVDEIDALPDEDDEVAAGTAEAAEVDQDVSFGVELPSEQAAALEQSQHHSLKHHLLGPSLTKAGQDSVDFKKVSDVIYEASKGSKFFNNEEVKDKNLTVKIDRILKLKAQLEKIDLKHDLRRADDYIASLELSRDLSQYVVHIDCDAFYAAVEEIDRPDLKTKPMAVGIGVITTCNYEARKYGVRSAMAGFVAKKLCPELICLPQNFDKYTAKAREVRAILAEYDPRFESSSIDEAYLNITEYCKTRDLEPDVAIEQLRNEVREKCKVTISAGIAANAKVAKICSNKNKPNGQFRIPNDRAAIMSFMANLPVRKVNGVGRVLERELDAIGVKNCGDLYHLRSYLHRLFGEKTFQFLIQSYLGLGRTHVQPADDYERKSVGTESTFRDISTKEELRAQLRRRAEELEKDMARVEVKGRTLCLKIKLHTYEVFTRQVVPPKAVCTADDLYNFALPMLVKLEKEMPVLRIRLMGLRCTHLISTKKSDLDFFKRRIGSKQPWAEKSNDEGEWEVWPDSEFEEAARQEKEDEMQELERLSQEHDKAQGGATDAGGDGGDVDGDDDDYDTPYAGTTSTAEWHEPFGIYKYGSESNSPAKASIPPQPQQWDCPVCQLPQPANDKDFNAHIDLCLSRETIKEAVAEAASAPDEQDTRRSSPEAPNRPTSATGGKRKGSSMETNTGRKQKRLFFT